MKTDFDPMMATEVMRLLEVENDDLENPTKYSQFQKVVSYFKGVSDWKYRMLKLINRNSKDNLKRMANYVELQEEKKARISQLKPEMFAEDIESELREHYITNESIKRAKKDVVKRMEEEEQRKFEIEREKVINEARGIKEEKATEASVEASHFKQTEKALNDIVDINGLLEDYEQ